MPANCVDNRLAIIEDGILNGFARDEATKTQRYIEAIDLVDGSIESVKSGALGNHLSTQVLTLFGCRRSVKNEPDERLDRMLGDLIRRVIAEVPGVDTAGFRDQLRARVPDGSILLEELKAA